MRSSLRYLGSTLILIAGGVHLALYFDGYSNIPRIGPLFLMNVVAAGLIALALAVRPIGAFAVAGLAFSVSTLVAFVLSRTIGVLGFTEMTMDTKALGAAVAEAMTLGVLLVWFKATRPKGDAAPVIGERRADTPELADRVERA